MTPNLGGHAKELLCILMGNFWQVVIAGLFFLSTIGIKNAYFFQAFYATSTHVANAKFCTNAPLYLHYLKLFCTQSKISLQLALNCSQLPHSSLCQKEASAAEN